MCVQVGMVGLALPSYLALIQPDFDNPGRNLRSRGETQLKQDIGDMRFDRSFADHQLIRDLAIGLSLGDQYRNRALTFG